MLEKSPMIGMTGHEIDHAARKGLQKDIWRPKRLLCTVFSEKMAFCESTIPTWVSIRMLG